MGIIYCYLISIDEFMIVMVLIDGGRQCCLAMLTILMVMVMWWLKMAAQDRLVSRKSN